MCSPFSKRANYELQSTAPNLPAINDILIAQCCAECSSHPNCTSFTYSIDPYRVCQLMQGETVRIVPSSTIDSYLQLNVSVAALGPPPPLLPPQPSLPPMQPGGGPGALQARTDHTPIVILAIFCALLFVAVMFLRFGPKVAGAPGGSRPSSNSSADPFSQRAMSIRSGRSRGASAAPPMLDPSFTKHVFISYRVDSDANVADKLCDKLRAEGVKVWLDRREIRGGKKWDEEFANGLAASAIFVPIISRKALARTEKRPGFADLAEDARCDNVLLEYRLAGELQERKRLRAIFPLFVGTLEDHPSLGPFYSDLMKEEDGLPRCADVTVAAVEEAVRKHLVRIEEEARDAGRPLAPLPVEGAEGGRLSPVCSSSPASLKRACTAAEVAVGRESPSPSALAEGTSAELSEGGGGSEKLPKEKPVFSTSVKGLFSYVLGHQGCFLRGQPDDAWAKCVATIVQACDRHCKERKVHLPPEPEANSRWSKARGKVGVVSLLAQRSSVRPSAGSSSFISRRRSSASEAAGRGGLKVTILDEGAEADARGRSARVSRASRGDARPGLWDRMSALSVGFGSAKLASSKGSAKGSSKLLDTQPEHSVELEEA